MQIHCFLNVKKTLSFSFKATHSLTIVIFFFILRHLRTLVFFSFVFSKNCASYFNIAFPCVTSYLILFQHGEKNNGHFSSKCKTFSTEIATFLLIVILHAPFHSVLIFSFSFFSFQQRFSFIEYSCLLSGPSQVYSKYL